ncbi:MAG: DUF1049 domain-containing protein [Chitinivibrionales bacterium]|nr:DUF1049 domain-containing protein [Chitinivibrionales bacterium]MBD3358511.1 DUF1049 domain-containing protein [Chitinivibrionales bacterium]
MQTRVAGLPGRTRGNDFRFEGRSKHRHDSRLRKDLKVRLLKWALFFAVSFVVSWILITTFSQWQFHTGAPIRIITYQTREFPLFYYPIGTFVIGLGIGLTTAAYNFFSLQGRLRRKNKETKKLGLEIDALRRELDAKVSEVREVEAHSREVGRVEAASVTPAGPANTETHQQDNVVGDSLDTEASRSSEKRPYKDPSA